MTARTVAQASCQADSGPGELRGLLVPPAPGPRGEAGSPCAAGTCRRFPCRTRCRESFGRSVPCAVIAGSQRTTASAPSAGCGPRCGYSLTLARLTPGSLVVPATALTSWSGSPLMSPTTPGRRRRRPLLARPTPQRLAALPAWLAVVESPDARPRRYHRQLTALRSASDVPRFATASVASLPPAVRQDSWYVVTYVRRQRVDAPFLFAQYGAWYLQVAAWE